MNRKILILYGSQTGTAQDISENIWRESKRFHLKGNVKSMNDYDVKQLIEEEIVIFVCSTTGQGEEPDNMKKFWKFLLRKNLPADSLERLQFGVLGLGDSSYQKFNFVAKRLHKRLMQLGAAPLQPVGLCDDQHDLGVGAVLFPWLKSFWEKVLEIKPLPIGVNPLSVTPRFCRWNVKKCQTFQSGDEKFDIYSDFDESSEDGYVEVVENIRTTAEEHFQDVRLISFCRCSLTWNPGDVAYIRPQNSTESVKMLFEIFKEHDLNIFPNDCVMLEQIDDEMPAPSMLRQKLLLITIATQYWDLNALPRPRAFEVLAYNCENELEKEKLLEFASFEGQEDLLTYVNRPKRTILEVLQDFPHATSKLNLSLLFELFQPIKPRPYSIASSMLTNRLDLLIAVVEYQTRLKEPRKGLCTNWLKSLNAGDRVIVSIKKGSFLFPTDADTPMVMVGPGTGLSIFRAILQDYQLSEKSRNEKFVLFFGCRNEEKDFHCRDELKRFEQEGILKLFCAFSRDQEDKIYVQHLIEKEGKMLKNLLVERGGFFYVSGSSKNMPTAVKEALEDAINDKEFIQRMIKDGKYHEETWS
ncbi:CLUMA_CG008151, isoform A [Clunio marinus]|uniref:NADPH-dependent diflavin oxidoreductase 1 n=1 Tax=Clunio marinus TaxID=568069 RepID=A0A1J1I379_9DIPT|nr:CLUMA_CG008151, isoform A [Clunio marinus]